MRLLISMRPRTRPIPLPGCDTPRLHSSARIDDDDDDDGEHTWSISRARTLALTHLLAHSHARTHARTQLGAAANRARLCRRITRRCTAEVSIRGCVYARVRRASSRAPRFALRRILEHVRRSRRAVYKEPHEPRHTTT